MYKLVELSQKFLLLIILIFSACNSFAALSFTITEGNVDPIPLAVNNFASADSETVEIADEIIKVVANDLKNSGMFRPISQAAFIERKTGSSHTPLFAAWQQINANLLLNGEVKRLLFGKIQVKFVLWDTVLEREMISETFELPETIYRRVAHKIADSIYKKITGYEGYFDTRIVYVAESGPYLKRIKRIAIMDQDGANHQYLTDGSDLVLTPRFSPDGNKILYLSYKNDKPQVYYLDLRHGKSQLLGHFPGMSFAPRFSPDGEYAIMSIARGGATHIYEIHLGSKRLTQLTRGSSINTSPSYSPDGSRIVFNSDRGGSRQLYIMNRDGSGQNRITYGGGTYAEPNWSSKNYIAFTKVSRTHGFTIGVLSPDDTSANNERLIAKGYLVESPSWAQNGRVIAFTKGVPPRGKNPVGLNRIHTIDFTGYNERVLITPKDASDPEWSGLRK